jgi:hypothetical protein
MIAPDNVRYLGQFGEHILTESFTARDPLRRPSARFSKLTALGMTVDPLITPALTAWSETMLQLPADCSNRSRSVE